MANSWVRDIHDRCVDVGIPLFVKQGTGPRSGQQYDLDDDLWACKEFPLRRIEVKDHHGAQPR
jgi:protein gp37